MTGRARPEDAAHERVPEWMVRWLDRWTADRDTADEHQRRDITTVESLKVPAHLNT